MAATCCAASAKKGKQPSVWLAPRGTRQQEEDGQTRLQSWIFLFVLCPFALLPFSPFSLSPNGLSNVDQAQAAQDASPASAPISRIDPKAQALLDQTIQTLGGQAFLSFKTLTTSGRSFSIADEKTTRFVTFDSQLAYPDKRRFAYGLGKKKPIVLINNGDEAWEVDRMGLTHQTAEQAHRWKITNTYSLENLLRLRTREPGVLVQDAGSDFIENLAARVLDIHFANRVDVKLYLNKANSMPVRITYRVQDPKTLEWDEYADVYGDFRSCQGIQTPMHITRFLNDERISETFRSTAKYDEILPASLFQPPGP